MLSVLEIQHIFYSYLSNNTYGIIKIIIKSLYQEKKIIIIKHLMIIVQEYLSTYIYILLKKSTYIIYTN